jgi:ribonuclease-3
MDVAPLIRLLDYKFNQPELLQQALTHRSQGTPNNERLEFLGDAMLNCLVAARLYDRFPLLSEGDLSRLRAHLVREATLAEVATAIRLGDFLRLGEGELKSGGFRRPSILADGLEAIIGAVYLDGGFPEADKLVGRLFGDRVTALDPRALGKDPKTLLQEYLQARRIALPHYRVVTISGEDHCQAFLVECEIAQLGIKTSGSGSSRRNAEQEAARRAYQQASAS